MEKLKVYCPYSSLDLGWETIKNLTNISFDKPLFHCPERGTGEQISREEFFRQHNDECNSSKI